MRKLVHLLIRGKVQGVGYRAFVEMQAGRLGLEGWVRNRQDGCVEAIAAGEADKVNALIEACRKGPPASRVSAVDAREATHEQLSLKPSHENFAVLPTV